MAHRPPLTELAALCRQLRADILRMIAQAGSGHPGGSLSMVELLVGLFYYKLRHDPRRPDWADRDVFLLSKGHGVPALYAALADRGYFPKDELMTLRKFPTRLQGHPERWSPPGIEIAAGSLGQGLSMANGLAWAAKSDGHPRRVYCLMGDGEMQEGQIWEAAMTAAHHHLDNVCGIVDANGVQQNAKVEQVKNIEPLPEKWRAFGWHAIEINGHDLAMVCDAYDQAATIQGQPTVIIARTVKGKGVSFMEGQPAWHGVAPNKEQLAQALAELVHG